MINAEILDAYRRSRDAKVDKQVLCHAPFVSLNFERTGRVTVCCYNRQYLLGTYPEQSVREIWTGARARAFRESFLRNEEALGCDLCFQQLGSRNFAGTLMRNFDAYSTEPAYRPDVDAASPRVLELEISNTCNLECVMCAGHWSSAIRANREKLPPLHSPYDHAFVDQLAEFLPSITTAKFLGGEPFLIERYYEIWERIASSNPGARLAITTNGTVVPERAKSLLEGLRANISVSLDALTPAVYEAIRKNARFDEVMANVEYFLDYTRRRGTQLTLSICPMTYNWRDLPALLDFCERRRLPLYFNTVTRPVEASLGALPASELSEVIAYLASHRPAGEAPSTRNNREQWEGLLNQLQRWLDDKLAFHRQSAELEARVRAFAARRLGGAPGGAVPYGLDRVVPPLVLSLAVARERSRQMNAGLTVFLPRVAAVPAEDGGTASVEQLLLAAHVLCRFVDDEETGGAHPAGGHDLVEEQRRLRRHLDRPGDGEELAAWDHWMRERIQEGEADVTIRWVKSLLEAAEGSEGAGRPGTSRGVLEEGLAGLRGSGLDEAGCQRIAAYFQAFVTAVGAPGPPPPKNAPDSPGASPEPGRPAGLRVRDPADLRRAMDAMTLFHRYYSPSGDHAAFGRRADDWLAMVSRSGKETLACRLLEGVDAGAFYRFFARASDVDLERRLASWLGISS